MVYSLAIISKPALLLVPLIIRAQFIITQRQIFKLKLLIIISIAGFFAFSLKRQEKICFHGNKTQLVPCTQEQHNTGLLCSQDNMFQQLLFFH